MLTRDVEISDNAVSELLVDKHVQYLKKYSSDSEHSYEQLMVEYLRMSGIYWTTTALQLMDNDFDKGLQ